MVIYKLLQDVQWVLCMINSLNPVPARTGSCYTSCHVIDRLFLLYCTQSFKTLQKRVIIFPNVLTKSTLIISQNYLGRTVTYSRFDKKQTVKQRASRGLICNWYKYPSVSGILIQSSAVQFKRLDRFIWRASFENQTVSLFSSQFYAREKAILTEEYGLKVYFEGQNCVDGNVIFQRANYKLISFRNNIHQFDRGRAVEMRVLKFTAPIG